MIPVIHLPPLTLQPTWMTESEVKAKGSNRKKRGGKKKPKPAQLVHAVVSPVKREGAGTITPSLLNDTVVPEDDYFKEVFARFIPSSVDKEGGGEGKGVEGGSYPENVTNRGMEQVEGHDPFNHLNEGVMDGEYEDDGDSLSDYDDDEDNGRRRGRGKGKEKLSKRKLKQISRLTLAELKQLVDHPEVVESWDVTSSDPALLIFLKSYRNSVAVPRHWNMKRKYLQNKGTAEKKAFDLPEFIKATGIQRMREAIEEKEAEKTSKQKSRERIRPKTGKMDIDYQVLHDAFFRHQTKPILSRHGDMYYEGKEFEEKRGEQFRPGKLSARLRDALGMTTDTTPPPWLTAMQRYGPPPAYPSLRLPGINAPLPPGCSFGVGNWGFAPVDRDGHPLFGDIFGVRGLPIRPDCVAPIERHCWGQLEEDVDEDVDEEEEEEEEEDGEENDAEEEEEGEKAQQSVGENGRNHSHPPILDQSDASASAISDRDRQAYVPETVNLRKAPGGTLFQEVTTTAAGSGQGQGLLPSEYLYVLPTVGSADADPREDDQGQRLQKRGRSALMELTLDPAELEGLTKEEIRAKVAEHRAQQAPVTEDVSDLLQKQQDKLMKGRGQGSDRDRQQEKRKSRFHDLRY